MLAASALACLAQPAASQSQSDTIRLSLVEARARALEANPELVAARLDTAIARGALRQAGIVRFNPSADVLGATSGGEVEAGISQELEVFGQRRARLAVGRAGLQGATAGVANTARLTIGTLDRIFYRLASATQRTNLAREVLALDERLADVARRQLAEGEISRLDYNLAIVELGRARARALATQRERTQATIELGRLIGTSRDAPILAVLDSAELLAVRDSAHAIPWSFARLEDSTRSHEAERLTAVAVARRPDLEARAAAVRQASAELRLARREALPNPIVRGVFEMPTGGGPSRFRPGIGVSLPFLNRNQGERAARRAAARQAELERAGVASQVRAEVIAAVSAYHSAAAEVDVLSSTVLAPARQNRQLAEVAYREGKIGLPVLLLVQDQAISAELEFWESWLVAREALATLAEATAENLQETRTVRPR